MRIWEHMKSKRGLLVLVTMLLMMAASVALAASYPFTGVTNDDTNVRSAPNSTVSNIIRRIPEGETVTVLSASGNFYRIQYEGTTGYVFKQYVKQSAGTAGSAGSASTAVPTAGPTLDPAEDTGSYQLLQSGADGNQVMALQEALIELGYLKGTADGVYGSATAQAVMALQKANSYPVTGYADANLQALIFNGKPVNASGKKTDIKTLPAIDGLVVRTGDKGVIVRTIQSKLMEKGYYTGAISGTYDSKTVTAVKAFQKKNGLTQDGVCGANTQTLLFGNGLSSSATSTPKPTAEPTPVPEMEKPKTTVRSGSKGNDAKLVQQRLIELGYLNDKADGKFGAKSVAALKAFQQKNKLTADGVAGSGTYEVLFSYLALAADYQPIATPAPSAAPTATPTPAAITKDNVVLIKQGVKGDAVLRLQNRLEQLGYYTSAKDGKCKADDVAAIRAFQQKNGLAVDGAAGYDTQVLLYSDSAIMDDGRLAGSLTTAYTTLKKGMKGDAVKAMQARLIQLGYLTGTADGVFGTDTAEAVYYFQKNNGLVRDSVAGEKTLEILFSTRAVASSSASATPSVTTPPATITTSLLKLGDSNSSVKAMQQTLISLGYLSGTADGVFGNLTYRAVKEFQKANALTADGIAGSQTIAALNSASSGSSSAPSVTDAPNANLGTTVAVTARNVKYEYWYSTVRNECRKYPYCTLYDPQTGISWQVHMFSYGKHAEIEPLTASDTEKMNKVCGKENWTPKVVWVIFADGTIRIATTHSVPHDVQHITTNNFPGHSCLHFPRTMAQVTAIGPYATKHQNAVDKAWAELVASLK